MMLGARTAAWSRNALPYDAEIEYLESTGEQWIDTSYVPKIGDSIRMIFRLTRQPVSLPYNQIMGAGTGTYQFCFPAGTKGANGVKGIWCRPWQGGTNYLAQFLASDSIRPDIITDFRITHLNGNGYHISVGSDFVKTNAMSEIDGPTELRSLLIFRRPNVGNAWIGCYAFQLWNDNGVSVLDLIPVRVGDVGYMYDRVTGELFGNAGTGAFVIGPDKTI